MIDDPTANVPTQPASDPPPDEEALGAAAAWRHLRLAAHAFFSPMHLRFPRWPRRLRLPAMPAAMRIYLAYNIVLYAMAASVFLVPRTGMSVEVTGLVVVDGPTMHFVWGVAAVGVCLSNVVALCTARWDVWQICAVLTAMWASGWGLVLIWLWIRTGNYTIVLLWGFVVTVHYLFINNHLVPVHKTPDDGHPPFVHDADPTNEHALAERLQQTLADPPEHTLHLLRIARALG